jgi:DNA-binding NarL/FixJ family response regulator
VDAFAASLGQGARALVLRGEPGIGKSALWRHAVERCRSEGFEVLRTRPAEEEMPLALVGLLDLFRQAGLDRAALEAGDDLARGRAVLTTLRRLAEARPTVVAIDDVQWLDRASARALRYGLRRLDAEPVGILVTTRATLGSDDPLGLASAFHAPRFESVDLGPLSLGALRRLLGGIVTAVSRPALRRIHEVSGGNPLYAIELARVAVGAGGSAGAPGGLALPGSLRAAIERRLGTVPGELTALLEAAAALGHPSVAELQAALPDADLAALLAAAAEHGLLVVEEDLGVRFAHPLIRSTVYGGMSPLGRRSLHARLAGLVADEDTRARHLALSTDEPDEGVAALLEAASHRAARRGAADLAAELARHSLRLTPADERAAADRRALGEIEQLAAAGEVSRALALSDRRIAALPAGVARAEALVQRFYLEDDDLATGEGLLLRALAEAGDDAALRSRVLDTLGWQRGNFGGDVAGGIGRVEEALAIAERIGDRRLELAASAHLGHLEALSGRPAPERMARALALEAELGAPHLGAGPRALAGKQLLWAGELAEARTLCESVHADALRSGNELERTKRLYDLALVECAAGDLTRAEELVTEGLEAAEDAENAYAEGWLLFPLALVEAWRGRAGAGATADRLQAWAAQRGYRPWIVRAQGVRGLLALSAGEAEAAARELGEAALTLEELGVGHPGAFPILPDAVEAFGGCGDTASADALLQRLERQAAALGGAWARAAAERSRAVLLAARGEADAAARLLRDAADELESLGHRPDAARAVLLRGRALLRGGHRTLAADALADARSLFADLGAELWAARATEELERAAPGRAAGELTAAERRIAACVAQGLTNREVGRELHLSRASVEAHLTRIYRKLGISSRSELARFVTDERVAVTAADQP